MELWFTEKHTNDVLFSIKVDRQLISARSEFQRIDVFESAEFGRILTLDGFIMITEKDEFIYHDMMVHVPMAVNPDIKSVLVVGAGDGGTVRELTRYPGVEHIDMVEIDRLVVDVCRQYFPQMTAGLSDRRVTLRYEDGLKFVRSKQNEYDLIIVDSTDPFGPGEGLFTREFFGNCHKALTARGIMVNQHESTYYDSYVGAVRRMHKRIAALFERAYVYQAHIPSYPSGHWLFGFASKGPHPLDDLQESRWNELGLHTRYYNTRLHKGAFALPNYIFEQLESEDE
ncbi:MAG: polyamine aminopropyltransferase [Oscillospiraceae bacterium]|nr:polyamine aminopropyltransferase [Oscillospiraceae bacterium]